MQFSLYHASGVITRL